MSPFEKIDFRIGKIRNAIIFAKARKPAYQLEVDFGPFGVKNSSAQLTFGYPKVESLINQYVVAIVNFPIRIIAGFKSQVLVTGFYADEKRVFLLKPRSFPETSSTNYDDLLGCRIGMISDERGQITTFDYSKEISIEDFLALKIVIGKVTLVGEEAGGQEGLETVKVDCASHGMLSTFISSERKLSNGQTVALLLSQSDSSLGFLLAIKSPTGEVLYLDTDEAVPLGTILA